MNRDLKQFREALATLEAKVAKKAVSKAVRRAMAPVRKQVKDTAPKDTGALQANVTLRTSARKSGKVYARVGIKGGAKANPDTPYYFRMIEFGTQHMPAAPFMRPALEANASSILDAAADELQQAIFG